MRWRWWVSASDVTTADTADTGAAPPPSAATPDAATAERLEQLTIRVRHLEELRVRVSRLESRFEKLTVELDEILERIGRLGGTQGGPQ